MARRTTETKVRSIIETSLTIEQIDPYIDIATVLVDEVATNDATLGSSKLELMERFLVAHLISVTKERRALQEGIANDTSVAYADIYGPGLMSTDYGQFAAQLDTTGTLAAQGRKRISIKAITSFN